MKILRILGVILALLLTVSGCSIRSSQLSSIIDFARGPTENYADSAWVIGYGDYRAQVQAVSFEAGILFSNNLGDQAFFDGWTVTRAAGLGLRRGSWSVRDDAAGRHFSRRSRLTSYPPCAPWVKKMQSNVIKFTQSCQGSAEYSNSILVNEKGEIVIIRQSLNAGASFVTLKKL